MTFSLAIVGRPNVGKSTLFNRLVGKRLALVDNQPGVTRDLREGAARLGDLRFTVIDTAGLEDATDESLQGRMRKLTERAVDMADVCLFLIDARTGVTPTDESLAEILRKRSAHVILAANKAEGAAADAGVIEAWGLGLGEPIRMSAEHGEGLNDLYAQLMPLADAFAIYFVEPFLLTAMSALFLGESVGWRRWLAILVGFGGALIVIQPSFEVFGAKALLPVVCAFLFALYLFLNRAVGDLDPPLAMQTLAGLGGVVFTGAILLGGSALGVEEFVPSLPSTTFLLMLLVVLGALSGYGHLLVVRAFRLAPLSVLAPFQYFEIISATLLGFLLFGDFPSPSKWLGVVIIVGSGLFIIWRARKRETAPPVAT